MFYTLLAVGVFGLGIGLIGIGLFTDNINGWSRLYHLVLSAVMFNGSRIFVKWIAEKVN